MNMVKQPWLHSFAIDGIFIILPPFLTLVVIALLPDSLKNSESMPVAAWVCLILLVDVAHVYSTLYRTYFDKDMVEGQKNLLVVIPLLSFVVGVILYTIGAMVFWRILAYIAIFHFVRQQYGFIRLYARKEGHNSFSKTIDALAIYSATLFPLLYWHISGPRNFNWFIAGDLFYFKSDILLYVAAVLYTLVLLLYMAKEVSLLYKTCTINGPKNLVMAGTYLSWFFGVVYFDGDIAFTALNVISHGIPYMALIWIFGNRKSLTPSSQQSLSSISRLVFTKYGIAIFLAVIFLLAYIEEGFWDALVWNEHKEVFSAFYILPSIQTDTLLAVIVPLLTLPQFTHYIIDGFIWKVRILR